MLYVHVWGVGIDKTKASERQKLKVDSSQT